MSLQPNPAMAHFLKSTSLITLYWSAQRSFNISDRLHAWAATDGFASAIFVFPGSMAFLPVTSLTGRIDVDVAVTVDRCPCSV